MIVVYQMICAVLALLVIGAIFRSRRLDDRLTGGVLLVVLLLRIALVK